jgi:hypothetical protein
MWRRLTSAGVIEPFLLHEKTVTDAVYLHILENYAVPQIPEGYVFQQDVAPSHFWIPITEFLNLRFTGMWIV